MDDERRSSCPFASIVVAWTELQGSRWRVDNALCDNDANINDVYDKNASINAVGDNDTSINALSLSSDFVLGYGPISEKDVNGERYICRQRWHLIVLLLPED